MRNDFHPLFVIFTPKIKPFAPIMGVTALKIARCEFVTFLCINAFKNKTMGYAKLLEKYKDIDIFVDRNVDDQGSDLKIRTLEFVSNRVESFRLPFHPDIIGLTRCEEQTLTDKEDINANFTFPIFLPLGERKYDKVIILLHGLNERSWLKYMPWAAELAKNTKSAVILFPISYHMNRAPKEWSDPRAMFSIFKDRQPSLSRNTSFANIALSERLKFDPLRFFTSGLQSADDLARLVESIDLGQVKYINKNPQIDFFSYSIGAFLAQILFIANPNDIVSNSRLFMFSGGAFFNTMNGVSKLIMDEQAFDKIFKYYTSDFEMEALKDTKLGNFIKSDSFGMAFRAMLNVNRMVEYRNDKLSRFKDQFYSIALVNDRIISPIGISSFFRSMGCKNIEMVDFVHPHSHEQPFPINSMPAKAAIVDGGFNHLFRRASSFLA